MRQMDETSQKIIRRQKKMEHGTENTKSVEIGGPALGFEKKIKK